MRMIVWFWSLRGFGWERVAAFGLAYTPTPVRFPPSQNHFNSFYSSTASTMNCTQYEVHTTQCRVKTLISRQESEVCKSKMVDVPIDSSFSLHRFHHIPSSNPYPVLSPDVPSQPNPY
ncbi:hypothetical protein BU24DRAFT_836 [Aaosphaeria arxii CBS 175.79]|uniref:Uncharacterized protein n=1 Tax=Aaosphaeria arxii CBS 175.79 TaxID=1450172 RepID=A0A6A5Y771_9PLEO|nr:uncharacterized protein BU24DRAFT_836 [Aaosphaeria arxii CBS 175.79]KAF2020404.1 hypothetical protein BU24DRAFT_836 [Aaosphaeria arxii CBS 175.79]